MKEILLGVGFLLIFLAPIAALGWIIYRLVKGGSGSDDYSIK